MGKRIFRAVLLAAALAAALFPYESWAGRGGHGRGGKSAAAGASRPGGFRPGGVRPGGFHHPHHFHRGTAVFIGGTFWPYFPPPYFYGPDYSVPYYEPPTVYVERFDGTPTPDTPGEIFCPGADAYYPTVTDCPGGWQRVLRSG